MPNIKNDCVRCAGLEKINLDGYEPIKLTLKARVTATGEIVEILMPFLVPDGMRLVEMESHALLGSDNNRPVSRLADMVPDLDSYPRQEK